MGRWRFRCSYLPVGIQLVSVEITAANEHDLEDLRSMAGYYMIDLARFRPPGIKPPVIVADEWLNRSTPNVFMIHAGGQVAGFICVAVRPCIPGVTGNYISDFYVKPEFRHSLTALLAGGALMRLLPGEWTTDVRVQNTYSMRWTRAMTRRYGSCMHERTIWTDAGEFRRFRWKAV